jgi:hypothetical protein
MPRDLPPKPEVTPGYRNYPTEQPRPPTLPERTIPDRTEIPERATPVLPGNNNGVHELPKDKVLEHPKEIVPPTQSLRPAPVVPGNGAPVDKGNDRNQDHP